MRQRWVDCDPAFNPCGVRSQILARWVLVSCRFYRIFFDGTRWLRRFMNATGTNRAAIELETENNIMKRAVFICGVTLSAIAVTAVAAFAAADRRGGPHMPFEQIDADGDGKITQSELQGVAAARFADADGDGDGFLTQDELANAGQKGVQRRTEKMIEHMDTDGDGKIALAEMKPRRDPAWMFDRIDADGDGAISKAEFDAAHENRKGKGRHSSN